MERLRMMKVLVCDDIGERGREVLEELDESGVANLGITPLFGDNLAAGLEGLFDRVKVCLEKDRDVSNSSDLPFDGFDVALFDNNLSHLDIKGARHTAEGVVGFVRAFTDVGYIVSLNKNADVDFDLLYLLGDVASRADCAVNTRHLSNRALWTRNRHHGKRGFAPWYWPELERAAARRREQIAAVRNRLDARVVEATGFSLDEDTLTYFSLHAAGALSPLTAVDGIDGTPLQELAFKEVFSKDTRTLSAEADRQALLGRADEGDEGAHEIIARVLAARIDFWFRRDVVGPQEILVDVPHLLMRMPFLLGEDATDIDAWNNVIDVRAPPFGLDPAFFGQYLRRARFEQEVWLPTPAFRPILKQDEELNNLFFESNADAWLDVVFCEDLSAFVPRSTVADGGSPYEFSTQLEGSWARRHVAKIPEIQYAPRSSFAAG